MNNAVFYSLKEANVVIRQWRKIYNSAGVLEPSPNRTDRHLHRNSSNWIEAPQMRYSLQNIRQVSPVRGFVMTVERVPGFDEHSNHRSSVIGPGVRGRRPKSKNLLGLRGSS